MKWQEINSVTNITSWYLYGQLNKPNLLSESIFRSGESNNSDTPGMTIKIENFYDFMTSELSPLRYANHSIYTPAVQSPLL